MRKVDVAIIGAGHAGLNALNEVRRAGCSWVLIDNGSLGTTGEGVGCVPSKTIIELARERWSSGGTGGTGGMGRKGVRADGPALRERVRGLGDNFVYQMLGNSVVDMTEGRELIRGQAHFVEPDLLEVNGERVRAGSIVVATGSRYAVPGKWRNLGDCLLTPDSLFDLEHLPTSVVVVGLGATGLELGQALSRLGVVVSGFDASSNIAGISDPFVNKIAVQTISSEFLLHLGEEVDVESDSFGVYVKSATRIKATKRLLVTTGRVANIPEGLSGLCETDERGVPKFDARTLQLGDLPVFIAGDATGDRMTLQDAAEVGRVAGANAAREKPVPLARKVPMTIVFSDPNIAQVGARLDEVPDAVVGQTRFGPVGRTLMMARNRGVIRLYAQRGSGRLLGASMVGPRVEHLAHLVAWSVQQGHTVQYMQQMPFYHPVIEEALQGALKDTAQRVLAAGIPEADAA
jgi:dihydrolipoamide dehydrogenase